MVSIIVIDVFGGFPTFIVSFVLMALVVVVIDKIKDLIKKQRSNKNPVFGDVDYALLWVLRPEVITILFVVFLMVAVPRIIA